MANLAPTPAAPLRSTPTPNTRRHTQRLANLLHQYDTRSTHDLNAPSTAFHDTNPTPSTTAPLEPVCLKSLDFTDLDFTGGLTDAFAAFKQANPYTRG